MEQTLRRIIFRDCSGVSLNVCSAQPKVTARRVTRVVPQFAKASSSAATTVQFWRLRGVSEQVKQRRGECQPEDRLV